VEISSSDRGRPDLVKRWHEVPDVTQFHGIDRSAARLNDPSATPETPAITWGVTTDSPIMPHATNDLDKSGNESSQTPAEPWLESAPQSWTFTPGSCQGSISTEAVLQSISSCESSYAAVSANLDAVCSHKDSSTTCIWPLADADTVWTYRIWPTQPRWLALSTLQVASTRDNGANTGRT
jgi:hypothetical protein